MSEILNFQHWINRVYKSSKSGVYQTYEWIHAKELSGNNFIFLKDSEEHPSSGIFAFEESIILPIIGKKKILFAWGNPLAQSEDQILKSLIEFKKVSKQYYYGTIMPPVVNPLNSLYEKAGYKKVDNYTVLIDLKKSEEELWQNLEKKSARWGVKTAEKNQLIFGVPENKEEIEEFYELYKSTAEKGNFKAEEKEFLIDLVDTKISKLFLIRHNNLIIGGGLLLIDLPNNYSTLSLTSLSEEGKKLQAMPFLYWNLILYSKRLGLNYFDLGGYDKEAGQTEKTFQINKFKERFGGQVVEQSIYATNSKYPRFRSILKQFRFLKGTYKKEK
ncbi:MAG: peptidoglycan bridge formation glycyltransferase FemA/FemB family protein [Nanoarchaeota archaeon]|nr:peptidoglycan bridge formation glycyltransferase FemA/FemB family protein [Nanoarchaeota archaeon]